MGRLLIVVDMQNDFIDGALGTSEAADIVEPVRKKVEEYLERGDEVIFTMDTHGEDYLDTLEGKKLPVVHCVKGTRGWELHKSLADFPGRRVEKNTFGSTLCAHLAAKNQYDSIELVGLCTDICVISNAILVKAASPEAPVAVDSSCCAGVTPDSHKNALESMRMCQIDVL